jgi:S-DNA-T family DNA segregation ATPase FtsK/SpoIIIE
MKSYEIPVNYLDDYDVNQADIDLESKLRILDSKITKIFEDNKIESDICNINIGPSVTLFEYKIDSSSNLNKIKKLATNIEMSIAKSGVKMIIPMPNKDTIGIEFPSELREKVTMKDLINNENYLSANKRLPICLGKSIQGVEIIEDLANFPHLLISGATGSGKSICTNSIIMSLIYRFSPDELNLVMIDPKMVELSMYNGIPHLGGKEVIIDVKKAITTLREVCDDMDDRYKILKDNGVKSIDNYNKISKDKMKYTVVIIDEFADLMLIAKKEIEELISRLVAMARAVGIHVVIATQRPSVDVVTGIIKANFPARIAFRVASAIDSRTVINTNGAESLLGKGDMLFLNPNSTKIERIQGAYISEEEITKVVTYLKNKYPVVKNNKVEEAEEVEEVDELVGLIANYIATFGKKPTAHIQREFKIPFDVAKKILGELK